MQMRQILDDIGTRVKGQGCFETDLQRKDFGDYNVVPESTISDFMGHVI